VRNGTAGPPSSEVAFTLVEKKKKEVLRRLNDVIKNNVFFSILKLKFE
jgi:hypothetical protein